MNFDDLKERLRESFQTLAGRMAESPAWNQLVEKYADLPPQGQKAALAGGAFAMTLLLLLVPSCVFMTSSTNLQDFEDKKQSMRELFRVNREVSAMPPAPQPLTIGELENRARGELNVAGLQQDQMGGVAEFDNKGQASGWIPKALDQRGVTVSVKKLNLQQIVDIGSRLQRLQSTAKLTGVEIRAQTEDPHYFDVVYKIVAFNLPAGSDAKTGSKNGSK